MAFVNERFPDGVSYGAITKIRHSTDRVRVSGGGTYSNKNWSAPLREFDVSHAMRQQTLMDQVMHFVMAVAEGMANQFPFKDWTDYQVTSAQGIVTAGQLYKRYTFGSTIKDRKIVLPESGSVTIVGGGSLDYLTGIITGGSPTGWSGNFLCKAEMATDITNFAVETRAGTGSQFLLSTDQILINEVR